MPYGRRARAFTADDDLQHIERLYVPWLATGYRWVTEVRKLSSRYEVCSGMMASRYPLRTFHSHSTCSKSSSPRHKWRLGRLESCHISGPMPFDSTQNPRLTALITGSSNGRTKTCLGRYRRARPVHQPNPVSGPYTEVKTFRTQLFELGLNPHCVRHRHNAENPSDARVRER